MKGFHEEEINFFQPEGLEAEAKEESRFYEKLKILTEETCQQLDAARETIFGVDLIERTQYIKDFEEEFSQFARVVLRQEFFTKAKKARLVFGGDIHDLEKATKNLIEVLENIQGPDLVIGVECVEMEKQEIIDKYLAGEISEEEFLKQSGLLEFIPQQARSYLKIFQKAKAHKIRVLALDSKPPAARAFSEEKKLEARDEMAAEKIVQQLKQNPNLRMYIIFGQAHFAEKHLPGKIQEKLPNISQLIFVQNVESLYNQALARFGQVPLIAGVAEVEKNKFALLDVSPLEMRYERLKNQYRLFEKGNEAIDSTLEDFFPYLLDFLTKAFDLDLDQLCFSYEEGKCEMTFEELFKNVDIGYEDKGLEAQLLPQEKEKLKRNKAIGLLKGNMPYIILKKGANFKEFVRATMEVLLTALQKAGLKKSEIDDEVLIYLGIKIAKPDLKPKNEKEKEGEKLWEELIHQGKEIRII